MNTKDIGIYNFPVMRRGDGFGARDFATIEQPAGTPLAISAARMQVRDSAGVLLLEWTSADDSITITGAGDNVVTLAQKDGATMAALPAGRHDYDLEVILSASGLPLTPLGGKFPITADITRD